MLCYIAAVDRRAEWTGCGVDEPAKTLLINAAAVSWRREGASLCGS